MDPVRDTGERDVTDTRTIASLVQAGRMDVLIHVLALEQHIGRSTVDIDLTTHVNEPSRSLDFESLPRSASAEEFFTKAHKVDWIALSSELTERDHEPPVIERATHFAAGDRELQVRYAPGGQMVDGAVDAALGLFFGCGVERQLGAGRPVDRSVNALRNLGWSHSTLRALLHGWAVLDPLSAVVLLKFGDDGYQAAHHELVCRYDVVHTEYDFLSDVEATQLQTQGSGSTHTMLVRAEPEHIDPVLSRNAASILGSYLGEFSVIPLVELWSPTRTSAPDAEHAQRIRKMRRKELVSDLVDRARGR